MDTKLPCIDCIYSLACKTTRVESNIGLVLTELGKQCSIFKSYITLEDLNFKFPDVGLSPEEIRSFTVPQAKRIMEFCSFMEWDSLYDLSLFKEV